MRYASAGAFRTALERRLLTLAQQIGVPLVRLRKLVAFDRLLARLMAVAPDRWVLKGAVALHFRVGLRFRSTMDLDLGRHDDEQAANAADRAARGREGPRLHAHLPWRSGEHPRQGPGRSRRHTVTLPIPGRSAAQGAATHLWHPHHPCPATHAAAATGAMERRISQDGHRTRSRSGAICRIPAGADIPRSDPHRDHPR